MNNFLIPTITLIVGGATLGLCQLAINIFIKKRHKKDDEYKSNNELLHELVDFLLPKDGLFEGDKCGGWIETVNVRLDKIEGKITSLSNAIHSNKWQGW